MQILRHQVLKYWYGTQRLRLTHLTRAERLETMDDLSIIAHYTSSQALRNRIINLLQTDEAGRAMLHDFGDTQT